MGLDESIFSTETNREALYHSLESARIVMRKLAEGEKKAAEAG